MNPKVLSMRKLAFASIVVLISLSTMVSGQSLQRQCMAAAGTSTSVEGIRFSQTVGQCYSSLGHFDASLSVHPGFQQAPEFTILDHHTETDIRFTAFPNPASSVFTVRSSDTLKDATLLAVDMQGRIVFQERFEALNSVTVDCSGWGAGVYALSVSDPYSQSTTSKLILEK